MFTTTQTSTNTSIRPEIRFSLDYLRSIHGMLKAALLVRTSVISLLVGAKNKESTSTGTRNHQRHNNQRVTNFHRRHFVLQLGSWHWMVVHARHAHLVPVSHTWEVLHDSLAANWDRSDLHHLFTLLHRITDGHFSTWHDSHSRRRVWIHNSGGLRIFRLLEVLGLEKRRTCTRFVEPINHNNHNSILSLSCMIISKLYVDVKHQRR